MDTLILIGQIILVILGLFLVLVILLQPAKTAGLGSIAGGAETFFGKNKSKSFEEMCIRDSRYDALDIVGIVISLGPAYKMQRPQGRRGEHQIRIFIGKREQYVDLSS